MATLNSGTGWAEHGCVGSSGEKVAEDEETDIIVGEFGLSTVSSRYLILTT